MSKIKEMFKLLYMAFAYDLYYKGRYLVWVKRFGQPYCAFMENEGEMNPTRLMVIGRRKREFLPDFPKSMPLQIWDTSYSLNIEGLWAKELIQKKYPFMLLANFVISADERYLSARSKKRALDSLEVIAPQVERDSIKKIRNNKGM